MSSAAQTRQNRHEHREPHGARLAQAAQAVLESKGEQWTDMRSDIFAVLAQIDKPASAYDIADMASKRRGKRVAPNSIYRILDLFVANNLAQRIESANAYIANAHPGCQHDCIFLVCTHCGEATHIDNDAVAGQVREIATQTGFTSARPVIEVLGLCAKCA